MRRSCFVLVVVAMSGNACGSMSEAKLQSEPTDSVSTSPTRSSEATATLVPATTALAPSTSEAAITIAPSGQPEQTIYRPEPIRQGDQFTAMILPAHGVVLDNSTVVLRIVELPDGRFVQLDLTNAKVPESAAFWTTQINSTARGKTTARQGSTMGIRVDRAVYGDRFTVALSATTGDGEVLATTGAVEMNE